MDNQGKHPFPISEYCVIFVDLLGHKKFLQDLSTCAPDEAQRRVSELSEPLRRFKDGVRERVAEAKDATRDAIRHAPVSVNQPNLLKAVDDVTTGVQQFSDSTLLYVKMGNPVSFIVLLMMIEFIAFRMLDDAGRGFLLRGGIAVGKGWEVDNNCLCGQVVADAYNLESKVSNWGRITTSELFLTRLNGICELARHCYGCWCAELLRPMLLLVQKDIDGMLFIDYLNPIVGELYEREHFGSDWFFERCEEGYKFINSQLERFRSTANKNHECSRLALRYDIMRGYWKSRLAMWTNIAKR